MPKIDFTFKCKKCGRPIELGEVFDPCPQCGFENLKESCRRGKLATEKLLKNYQKIQKENDKRKKDPNYHGPKFGKVMPCI